MSILPPDSAFVVLKLITDLVCDENEDIAEEYLTKSYIAMRLKPLINQYGITKLKLGIIAEIITEKYLEENYSIDLIINAVYNYINEKHKCPPDKLLSDDIVAFLEDYENKG